MIFTADITTPITASEAIPKVTKLKVTRGLLYKIEVEFPPGPCGLLYVSIYDGGHQIYPSNPGVWFHAENFTISFEDTYLKLYEPFEYMILTYNDDDTYEHFCQVRMGIVSEDIFMARFLPHLTWDYFKEMLREMQAEQDQRNAELITGGFTWPNRSIE